MVLVVVKSGNNYRTKTSKGIIILTYHSTKRYVAEYCENIYATCVYVDSLFL